MPPFNRRPSARASRRLRQGSSHAVFNAKLGYAVNKQTRVTLAVDNLTDRHYYARVGGLNAYNIYGQPRNVRLNVRTHF